MVNSRSSVPAISLDPPSPSSSFYLSNNPYEIAYNLLTYAESEAMKSEDDWQPPPDMSALRLYRDGLIVGDTTQPAYPDSSTVPNTLQYTEPEYAGTSSHINFQPSQNESGSASNVPHSPESQYSSFGREAEGLDVQEANPTTGKILSSNGPTKRQIKDSQGKSAVDKLEAICKHLSVQVISILGVICSERRLSMKPKRPFMAS